MTVEDRNFEPYIDWDEMSDEMAEDVYDLVVRYKQAQDDLVTCPAAHRKTHAIELMQVQGELAVTFSAVQRTLYVLPMMVHIAGPKKHGTSDEGLEQALQRCKRCGSVLQCWEENFAVMTPDGPMPLDEDGIPWWDEGDVVAKSSTDGHQGTAFYLVEDPDNLQQHEKPCPDLAKIIPS